MVGSLGLFKAVVSNSHAVRFCSPAWEAKAGAGWFWFYCVCVCLQNAFAWREMRMLSVPLGQTVFGG